MLASAIVMITVTGAVFYLCLVILQILSKAYEEYRERYVTKNVHDVSDMVLFVDPRQVLVLNVACGLLLGLASFFLINLVIAVAAALFGFFIPSSLIRHYRKRRISKFN